MNYPSSFCTINTKSCKQELLGLLLSLSLHHPNSNMYILCDTESKKYIEESSPQPKLNIKWFVELDKYSNFNRQQMEKMKIWDEFQMAKADIINYSLINEKDALFIDSDIIILDKIELPNNINEYDIGVSPHYMKKHITDRYGYYNGGVLWTSNKELPKLWREYTKTSRYYDQASIEDLVKHYSNSYFEFGENYNLQTWRFVHSTETNIKNNITVSNNQLYYKVKPLKFIHTHFNNLKEHKEFNMFFIEKLKQIKRYKELAIIYRIINGKWIITIPTQPRKDIYNHANDSFRILPYLYKKHYNDVDVQLKKDTVHCCINSNIILYDRPTLDWVDDGLKHSNLLLLGNGDINDEGQEIQKKYNINVIPWIFWTRRPDILEDILDNSKILLYNERTINSIFIGNFENNVQEKYRNTEIKWENVLSEYHCTKGHNHKFSQEQYLNKLRNSKYGLCIRGYGKKCHREVELMAFGTVPVITKEVNISSYYDPPIENIHYLKADTPEEFNSKINNINEEKWTEMSNACYTWYQNNVYSKNSWGKLINYILYQS